MAHFSAVRGESAFSLEGSTFYTLPDFIQAHFAEAPRLDNVVISPTRSVRGDIDGSARYRALKRLAIQGHDHKREQEFFAGEIKSQRFITDWHMTWRLWSNTAWSGVMRFWFGWLYQIFSSFSRSLTRPLVFWLLAIVIGAGYMLGQSPDVAKRRGEGNVLTYATTSWQAWENSQPCYAGLISPSGQPDPRLTGLAEPVRAQTSAATEALRLALRNAFIILDGGGDAAHRTFGCLYGIERYGDNPVAIVPSNVAFAFSL